ncbi:MAG: hypothetical protein EOP00_14010 [Pedobacter sp.]|nr:MAG: hypothetical protein EOP00_14010 [Pedobacter sp.]
MKSLKYFTVLLFMLTFSLKSQAQNLNNLSAALSEGYTIDELHDLCDIITLYNHRTTLEKRGYKFEKDDGSAYIYKKNDYVSFYINYEDGKLSSVHFKSSPQKFYQAVAIIKDNSNFTYSSEKASGTGKLTYYNHKGHSMSVNDNYYRVTMWPKEPATTSTSTVPKTTPTVATTVPTVVETYYSAKEFADAVNPNIRWADLNFSNPAYKFDVKGSIDMDKPSIKFISKQNVLYIQMNIPRNGQCDYGLKEVKAKWTGQAGQGDGYFYYTFAYEYICEPNTYKSIYVYFRKPVPSFTKEGVEAWIRKNAY